MLFCRLGRAHSLRETRGGLRSSEGTGSRKFRFNNKLANLDSTVIDLCATPFSNRLHSYFINRHNPLSGSTASTR